MSGIADVVAIQITANTRTPSRAGFGTPLFMAYHTENSDLIRTYSGDTGLADMVTDGFATHDPAYRMAAACLSQNPHVEEFKVARLTAAHTLAHTVTILSAVEGEHVLLTVTSPDGTVTEIDYTIPGAATTTTVATAVEALIEACTGITSSASVAEITVGATTPGQVYYLRDGHNVAIKETTADANYDDDLIALQLVDDDWYFVGIDTGSEANNDKVAAWAETQTKIFVEQSQDSLELTGAGSLFLDQKALGYARTVPLYVEAPEEYGACALIGRVAPKDPGSITWKFKELKGITPSGLSSTAEGFLKTANANWYTTIGGLSFLTSGIVADAEFADIVHGTDWLKARIQEAVLGLLVNADKVPYTDPGVDSIRAAILAVLGLGVKRGFLVANTLTCTAPKVAGVATADKAARLLPDVKFGADLAGAIHKVSISGTLAI